MKIVSCTVDVQINFPNGIAELLNLPVKQVMSIIGKINLDVHRTGDDLQYASDLESKVYLTNQILKDADAMGMWHGIEVRTPFLDIALVQKVRGIASRIRFLSGKHKFLLTNSYKDILSPRIAQRKKQGFTFPFSIWMRRHPDFLKTLLPFGKPVDKLVAEFNHGHDHWSKIWSMVVIAQLKIHGNRTCEITPAGNNYPKVKVENLVHS